MESLVWDLRHACRTLLSSPGFALSAVLSIGLGIGANTTVFAWMDAIVRNPFPAIPDGGALVALNVGDQDGHVEGMSPIAYPTLLEWTARTAAFQGVAAHAQVRLNLRPAPAALGEPVWVELTAASFFPLLGVHAAAGRAYGPDDEAAQAAVVVLSDAYWRRRFGAAADVVGRTLLFNGTPLTVVGIAPPRFDGVVKGLAFDAWIPIWQQRGLMPGPDWMRDRRARRLQAVARLRPGVTLRQANDELLRAAREVSWSLGETPVTGAGARWIGDTQLGSLMAPLSLAMIAVTAVVLLAACANVAGLLLARAANRQRQTAIHVAVGASRARLVQQPLVQSAVLATAGCVCGLWIAGATRNVLVSFVPRVALPVSLVVDLNWRVMLFAAVAAMVAALLFAVLPALRASRPDVVHVLKSAAAVGSIGGRWRLRQALVMVQIAFSLVALSTAGLFLRSIRAAADVPLGFADPARVLLVATDLSFTRLEGDARVALMDRALETARALPGVTAAAAATAVPLSFGGPTGLTTRVDGHVPAPGESMFVGRVVVTDGYFETMAMSMASGRALDRSDRAAAARTAVVNEALVRRYWPDGQAIGRRLDQGDGWAVVVGVVRDSVIDTLGEPPRPLVYVPFGQATPDALTLHVRTATDPLSLVEPLRRTLAAVHADLPVLDPGTLADHMQAATFVQSVGSSVFGVFGLVALLIAATGLYGVMASYVAERRRDIAVSVALGAAPSIVVRTVAGPAARLTALGLLLGAGLAALVSSLVRNQLVGVSPIDALSLAGSAAFLVAVAFAACCWPVWRAVRLDPVTVLRSL